MHCRCVGRPLSFSIVRCVFVLHVLYLKCHYERNRTRFFKEENYLKISWIKLFSFYNTDNFGNKIDIYIYYALLAVTVSIVTQLREANWVRREFVADSIPPLAVHTLFTVKTEIVLWTIRSDYSWYDKTLWSSVPWQQTYTKSYRWLFAMITKSYRWLFAMITVPQFQQSLLELWWSSHIIVLGSMLSVTSLAPRLLYARWAKAMKVCMTVW